MLSFFDYLENATGFRSFPGDGVVRVMQVLLANEQIPESVDTVLRFRSTA